jgi:phage shock protein PspC (stress-responsive transcriptional regulator)
MAAKRLTRSETDRKIAGVCGGLAEYFDLDPTLVRVGAVVAALMGWGVLAYIVIWIVVPKASSVPAQSSRAGSPNALRIAEERYARGEITADELAKIRADLTA